MVICLYQPQKQAVLVFLAASRSTPVSREKATVVLLTLRPVRPRERRTTTHKTAAVSQCKLDNRMKGMEDECRFLQEPRIPATLVRYGISFFSLVLVVIALP